MRRAIRVRNKNVEKILVIDNEKSMRDFLAIVLKKEGYLVAAAENGEAAVQRLEKEIFDLVITDLKMPKMGGIELLKNVKEIHPNTVVLVMTAFASTETAIEAMKEGAYDYLTKPFQIEEVKLIIRNALEKKRLKEENFRLKRELKDQSTFSNIVGRSEKMKKVLDLVQKVSDSKSNILIFGESGTGKELIARAIHFNSSRREKPFVTVNCGALPESLLESELFGHMKGSFTGAVANKEGLFEVAHEGSIFLDEIGDTSPSIQVKLLRVLQEKEFRRVGGTKNIRVDVRIIAATNKDLEKAISEGKFREDLYYRLDVIPIYLPPLRERVEDIPLLSDHFLKRFNQSLGKQVNDITAQAMKLLAGHEWRGNVRELENVMERAVALANAPSLTANDFKDYLHRSASWVPIQTDIPAEGLNLEGLIGKIEKELLLKALEETHWVKKEAAKWLHLDFRSFRYRLNKYGIQKVKSSKETPSEDFETEEEISPPSD
jgi:two-component system response regulator PilR (NtrC family)